jgi:hypothetical protein
LLAGPLWLDFGQPVVTYSTTPGMPEVLSTWCAAAWTVTGPPPTPGGMTSRLLLVLWLVLLRLAAYQATPPIIKAATTPTAPTVIRLRRRSARFCWARKAATRSLRAACLLFFALGNRNPRRLLDVTES